jgi:hypothetical protein
LAHSERKKPIEKCSKIKKPEDSEAGKESERLALTDFPTGSLKIAKKTKKKQKQKAHK